MENPFSVVIITGLSGSGKSTAVNVFEDLGFFTVDGLPAALTLHLVRMFAKTGLSYTGLALGMDMRQSTFAEDYKQVLDDLRENGFAPRVVFLEAKTPTLIQRYAVTRRPHPLEKEGLGLEQAVAEERHRLRHLRKQADLVLDTTTHSIHDLRRVIQAKWQTLHHVKRPLRVHIISFGFKYGTPTEADMIFDLRFLPNPYFVSDLRPLSGKDAPVADFVLRHPPGMVFIEKLTDFLRYVLAQYEEEGRFRLTIGIGCTGGRHRSVAVAEALAAAFEQDDYTLTLEHRHIELG